MSSFTVSALSASGMGNVAAIIAGVVGPLAEAGAGVFSTISNEKIAKKGFKARQAETQLLLAQRQREALASAKLQEQQARMSAVQGQISSYATTQNVKIALGVVAVLGVMAAVASVARRR